MKTKHNDIIMQSKIFGIIAMITGLLLLIPLLARFPWTLSDFIIAGVLLFGTGSLFVLLARLTRNKMYRLAIAVVVFIIFFLVWAELAVGLFGTPFAGS
jgi:hypothetical protein